MKTKFIAYSVQEEDFTDKDIQVGVTVYHSEESYIVSTAGMLLSASEVADLIAELNKALAELS